MRHLHQGHRPGKQEGDLKVENDEQDRDQVEADVELHPRIFEGRETAFVGRQLFGVRRARGHDKRPDHENQADGDRDAQENDDRQVLKQEGGHGDPNGESGAF